MEADLYRAIQLQSLLKQELSRNGQRAACSPGCQAAMADGASFGLPDLPAGCQQALAQVYSDRPDLAGCRSDLSHSLVATQPESMSQYETMHSDPSQLAYACELLYQRVYDEPLLRGFFEHIDTGRLQSMVNTAVCKCAYYVDKPEQSFLNKLQLTHADLDIGCGEQRLHSRCE